MKIYHINGQYVAIANTGQGRNTGQGMLFYGNTRIEAITRALEEIKLTMNGYLIM
jgi:hypothetical protein